MSESQREIISLKDFIVTSNDTLRSALKRMTKNKKGVLFVCHNGLHLVGVLSDGDVRRTLLGDTLLDSAVSKAMNTDPISASTSAEAIALLRRLGVVAVPVVGSQGQVVEAVIQDEEEVRILKGEQSTDDPDVIKSHTSGAVAIIPARGGSKRIAHKNLAKVAGKPLVTWAILAAKAAKDVSHVLVSTDDDGIAEEARTEGAEVARLRPLELARDDTPTLDVVRYELNGFEERFHALPESCVLLEPTAPLRTSEHIDRAIEMLAASDGDSVVSVSELPHVFNPEEVLVIDNDLLRPFIASRSMDSRKLRGKQSPAYVPNGLVYAFRSRTVLEQQSLYGQKTLPLVTPWEDFLDIDTSEDLQLADLKMRRLHM